MSYQTYNTDAIVCGSYDRLTADRTYLLLTEQAGMVYATARSAREERSKQRYSLQDFSLIRGSLVRGKQGWRVGSVEPHANFYSAATDRAARGIIVATVTLLRRLLTGEEAQPELFKTVKTYLFDVLQTPVEQLNVRHDLFTLRLLATLGYIAPDPSYNHWINTPVARDELIVAVPPAVRRAIEEGLAASHL